MKNNFIQETQEFLQTHCADAEDHEELVNALETQVMVNARPLLQGLKSLETLLTDETLKAGTYLTLVSETAKIKLENPTDENAKTWLVWLAKQIRKEIAENLLPFQPMRAKLVRRTEPSNERYPHDLLLYPTNDNFPEYWFERWDKNNPFYSAFMQEWDKKTCPTCNLPTMQTYYRQKLVREQVNTPLNSTLYYDKLMVYECTNCHCGWTEYYGATHHTEVDYP